MNRSILIVICDFLLVSLLAFSTVDINKVSDEGVQRTVKVDISTNQVDSGKDLAAVMRLALNDERRNREQLMGELTRRERDVQRFQEQLQNREQQSARLQEQQSALAQQYAVAQTNIERLNQQLQGASSEAVMSREKLAAMEAEAKKQSEQAAALQRQLSELSNSNQAVIAEKQQLSTQLQVAVAEKRAATEQAGRMAEDVKVERAEKAKLAEGVKALATKSSQLADQIRDNQPLAPNTIFNDFVTNRVEARFNAVKSGLFSSNRRKDTETILVTDGTNTFALCHVQDTPLTLWDPGTDWEGLTGMLSTKWETTPIRSVLFSMHDPRIVWIPVTDAEARQLSAKIYHISPDPYKFQDAVLVGTQEPYYGECKFEIDLSTPEYVRLDRNLLRGLFGKFNPSRGDLVFSRTGELLGIMANGTYCLMIRNFDAASPLQFGEDVRSERTGVILSQLYLQLAQLPTRLQ